MRGRSISGLGDHQTRAHLNPSLAGLRPDQNIVEIDEADGKSVDSKKSNIKFVV